MSNCNCNQGRLPCTCKTDAVENRLAYLDKLLPQVAGITHYLSQNGLGTIGEDCLPRALELIKQGRAQEAELYAAQDQVTGLQELMRTQRMPEHLDFAVRQLVNIADLDPDGNRTGSPQHCHEIPGHWDGDATNAKGTLCEECAAWNALRHYVATDIQAVERVMIPVPQPMDTAPVDGTRVLIHTEVHHYSADRYGICAWRMIGSQWLEARFKDGKWVKWCGNDKTSSTSTLHPLEWAPLPAGAAQ